MAALTFLAKNTSKKLNDVSLEWPMHLSTFLLHSGLSIQELGAGRENTINLPKSLNATDRFCAFLLMCL
jgi:hypothetical protein